MEVTVCLAEIYGSLPQPRLCKENITSNTEINKQSTITVKNYDDTTILSTNDSNYLITKLTVLTSIYSKLTNDLCLIEVHSPVCTLLILSVTARHSITINGKLC